jgi:hypothetical protein
MMPDGRVDLSSVDGAAAYAYFFSGQPRPPLAHFESMGLRLNWDASFPWLYHGPWLPYEDARYFPLVQRPSLPASSSSSLSFPAKRVAEGRHEPQASAEWGWLNCNPAGHGAHQATTRPDWPRCVNMSYALLRDWYRDAAVRTGASTLIYGTIEEYGMGLREVDAPLPECEPAVSAANYSARLVCGANRLLRDRFPDAILRDASRGGRVQTAAWTSLIVDPATPAYEAFLLENARRVAREFSGENANRTSVSGVCLDRGDWSYLVNLAADDGVSATADGHTVRPLLRSWRQVVPKLAEVLHAADQRPLALFVNPDRGHRIDMYQGADGIFDEMGDPSPGGARTASGWLTVGGKVGAIWCHDPNAGYGNATKCAAVMTNGTDSVRHRFLQSHLLFGLFPSVPVVDNDHQIQPAARADAFYARYGPLWTQLRAKRWLLTAHAVAVVSAPARGSAILMANAFERRPYGSGRYAIALAFGSQGNATVRLALPELAQVALDAHLLAAQPRLSATATLLDGEVVSCACSLGVGGVDITVPLREEGCGVVHVSVG